MSYWGVWIASHRHFQKGDSLCRFLQQIHYLAFEGKSFWIIRVICQDFVGLFHGLIKLLVLDQKLDVELLDVQVSLMLALKRGKFGKSFFLFVNRKIEVTQHAIPVRIIGPSFLGLLQNFLGLFFFPPSEVKGSEGGAGDGVVGGYVQGSEILGFGLGPSILTLAKTSHLQPRRHEFRI